MAADTGIHPLLVFVTVIVSDTFGTPVAAVPDTVITYFIDVQMPVGESGMETNYFSVGSPFPNPSEGTIWLPIKAQYPTVLRISLQDLSGRILRATSQSISEGIELFKMELNDIEQGAYFIVADLAGARRQFPVLIQPDP